MRHLIRLVLLLLLVGVAPGTVLSQEVTFDRLVNADNDPNNWITYYRNYQGWRFSPLKQINTANVKKLVPKWTFQTGPDQGFQVSPLVVDGAMYVTSALNNVFALDAETGKMLWRYNYENPEDMPSKIWGKMHRGVTISRGKLFMGTMDAHLIALDAQTGKLLWKAKVGDYSEGQGITNPPLIVKDKAVIGVSTLEFPTRGFISAYSVDTGERLWQLYTIPGPGEPGNETWLGDSWKTGGGGVWLPPTYDPELNLIYFGTGNAHPMYYGADRSGDNLYTASIIAMDPDAGKMKWYFQVIPHDVWDYDSMNETVLADVEIGGRMVKALFQANKNGYLYALDRTNGRFLYAKPFISRINWAKGIDAQGRPIVGLVPSADGISQCPSLFGAKSFNHMAYNPMTRHFYVPAMDMCNKATSVKAPESKKGIVNLGGDFLFQGEGAYGVLEAIDATTGEVTWQHRTKYPLFSSALATAGGLVFTGDVEGNFMAVDDRTGERLWQFRTSSGHRGSAISYAVGGKQYIAVPAGWGGVVGLLAQAFPELKDLNTGSTLFVFGLPD